MVRVLARQEGGYLRRPLNFVFGAPSHVAVLRALAQRPTGATGGELARAAGVAHQATLDALARLEWAGMASRLPMGRGYMFRLNREHSLVKRGLLPLLEEEVEFGARLRAVLRKAFGKRVESGLIFGSAGRHEDLPESDLDVCLIVRYAGGKEPALRRAGELADEVRREFGLRLSPIAFTAAEFTAGLRRGDPLMTNIARDGERFVGRSLGGVVHA